MKHKKTGNFPSSPSQHNAELRSELKCSGFQHHIIPFLPQVPIDLVLICRGASCNRRQQGCAEKKKKPLKASKQQKQKAKNYQSVGFWALTNFQFMNYTYGCVMLLTVNITLFPKVHSRQAVCLLQFLKDQWMLKCVKQLLFQDFSSGFKNNLYHIIRTLTCPVNKYYRLKKEA